MSVPLLVLIYGESSNDTGALRNLVPALMQEAMRVDTRPIRTPIVLSRDAGRRPRAKVADLVARTERVEAASKRSVIVVAHRDADALEPAHMLSSKELCEDLRQAGVRFPVAAVPAWDIETWWMQFPEAFASCPFLLEEG